MISPLGEREPEPFTPNLYTRLAPLYDAAHRSRDYESETAFLAGIATAGAGRPVRVLDMFCGTGGHTLPLARMGFDVAGLDSAPEMLAIARDKAGRARLAIDFHLGDCRM